MPHETEIVIRSFAQPVHFGEHRKPTKCRVWWFAVLPVVTFILGLLF